LWVQEQSGIPVIKVLNPILATSIQGPGRPKGEKNRIAIAVSGDDTIAKEIVFKLVEELGFDPFEVVFIFVIFNFSSAFPAYQKQS
jgi:predicted dinucleotide-binding enzyme